MGCGYISEIGEEGVDVPRGQHSKNPSQCLGGGSEGGAGGRAAVVHGVEHEMNAVEVGVAGHSNVPRPEGARGAEAIPLVGEVVEEELRGRGAAARQRREGRLRIIRGGGDEDEARRQSVAEQRAQGLCALGLRPHNFLVERNYRGSRTYLHTHCGRQRRIPNMGRRRASNLISTRIAAGVGPY